MSRPHPTVVRPGSPSTQEHIGRPPSDAVVLFDGHDLSAWEKVNGDPVEWRLENGVLVQDSAEPAGPTGFMKRPPYEAHPDKLPVMLQENGDPVRYRNIWIRDLELYQKIDEDIQPKPETEIILDTNTLNKYIGKYEIPPGYLIVKKDDEQLGFYLNEQRISSIFPTSETVFF